MSMVKKMSVKKIAQSNVAQGELVKPTPSKIDLRNSHAIRRELASVYRDMRSGKVDAADGTKLAYVLDMIRKCYETSVLENRFEQIEAIIKSRGDE